MSNFPIEICVGLELLRNGLIDNVQYTLLFINMDFNIKLYLLTLSISKIKKNYYKIIFLISLQFRR